MPVIAKLFTNGRSQAIRIPSAFRFEGSEVFIRRDETTGDVILSARPTDWSGLLEAIEGLDVPDDFLRVPEDLPPASSFAADADDDGAKA
ncbi:MAG: AbrB/MazE/SpoVT family DNA-binding domain-containing protein [Burkholderiaceae bacterium]